MLNEEITYRYFNGFVKCPFCGGSYIYITFVTSGVYYAKCEHYPTMGCGAEGPRRPTEKEAKEAWNKRGGNKI